MRKYLIKDNNLLKKFDLIIQKLIHLNNLEKPGTGQEGKFCIFEQNSIYNVYIFVFVYYIYLTLTCYVLVR
jgi:hypothetical protein